MKKMLFFLANFFLLMLFSSTSSFAQFTLDLNVPLYGQDTSYYCGAASGQMIMMGYPNPTDNACYGQDHIYNRIQAHKQDNGFYSDPDGLRDAVTELNAPPPPGQYLIFHNTNREIVMHDILYWMAKRNYPTATLINDGDHWVVITGFDTDSDPQVGSATLQTIDIHDPLPADTAPHDDPCTAADEGNEGGIVRHVVGASWYSNDWSAPNSWGTKWLNEYVAIVEPPKIKGRITAKKEKLSGKVISRKRAIELALQHAKERGLFDKDQFKSFRKTTKRRALLVNSKNKRYFIVSFELEKPQASLGAILLNAFTGEFQEIGAFPHPLEYLSEEEAQKIACCSIRACCSFKKEKVRRSEAELIFTRSEQTKSRYRPVWKITMWVRDTKVVRYVSQLGQVYLELTPPVFGGD